MSNEIKEIGIIGVGYMGKQIAIRAALYDYDVHIYDVNSEAMEKLKKFQTEKIKTKEQKKVIKKITFHGDITEAVKNTDLIIEAVPEKLELKKDIFSQIDRTAPPHAIIATNSSSFPISKIEDVVERKDKVLNIHFYHLIKYPMADIMKGTQTSNDTFQKGKEWVESIGITPLIVNKECYGFVFNRIWHAIKKDCLKIWAGGYADVETVDQGWKIFTGMVEGPFQIMDNIGLDVIYDIEMSYYNKSSDPEDKPPQILKDMVDKGLLGRKSGKGFYEY